MATLYDNKRGTEIRRRIVKAIATNQKYTINEITYHVNHDGGRKVSRETIKYHLTQLRYRNIVACRPQYAGFGGYLWYLSKQGWDEYNKEQK